MSLPEAWAGVETAVPPPGTESVGQIRRLRELLRAEVKEFRRPLALACPLAGMVCLIVMAMAVGVVLGPADLAQFADTLSQAQLRSLGFRRDRRTGRQRSPKKPCFGRVWRGVEASDAGTGVISLAAAMVRPGAGRVSRGGRQEAAPRGCGDRQRDGRGRTLPGRAANSG